MTVKIKHILVVFQLLLTYNISFAQYFLFSEAPIDIEASFSRHTIVAAAKQTFFNSLTVKNKANRPESFTLNITVPEGWSVVGKDKIELTVPPLDSIIIPIRVAIGGNVRGDIGYSVIASLTDFRGNTIKNEYCFVKIPRDTDLNIRYASRMFFLDPISLSTEFTINVNNKGNKEELVNFIFDGNGALLIGPQKEALYSQDLTVPPYTDTTFSYRVSLQLAELFGRKMFGLQAKIQTIDTSYSNTLWFRLVGSSAKNEIPPNEKPLSIEFYAQGLLDADMTPTYSLNIEGRTLFKGESEVYYLYRNFSSKTKEDLYLTNRMFIGSKIGPWTFEIGDSYISMESSMSGRGGYIGFEGNKLKTELIGNRNFISNIDNFGGSVQYRFYPGLFIKTGGTYNLSSEKNIDSKLGFLGVGFSIKKRHKFFLQYSLNNLQRNINGKNNHQEYGWQFNYSSRLGPVTSFVRTRYGSYLYFSPFAGRFEIMANTNWKISETNQLNLSYNEFNSKRKAIRGDELTPLGETNSREGKIQYRHFINPEVELFAGPVVDHSTIKGIASFPENESFSSLSYKASGGARIKNQSATVILTPGVEFAYANILNNPYSSIDSNSDNRRSFIYYHLSTSLRSRSFMLVAFYTSGPRSAFDQQAYLQSGKDSRKLQFMPTYDQYIYKDIVKANLGVSYSNDLITKSRYTNITGTINWYLPKYWELQFLGVYAVQNRLNLQDLLETYQTLYLELGIKKQFDIQQPRVKFYDIELVFFKDFNGNFKQESNEPGIKNVLVSIEKLSTDVTGRIPGDFFSTELLSNSLGKVTIEKIPEGIYKISYNPLGSDVGTYSKAIEDSEIKIDHSGVYVFPFVEKNKVFGKIILNRSRLSGLGKIDASNVRITATDSQGRSHTTLTDKNGEFVLFAPVTDEYILTINNIYYENFDLRQNNFLVQFNGYKQFEVNFVFDEKVRRIQFASGQDDQQTGVMQIRRTNISGTVKDANSQRAVRSRINLINTRNNSIVTSTNSSPASGEFTLNFMAGDNYLLEILAEDYWYHSENIVLQQVTTFMNINRDILLRPISIGSKVELNIRFGINSAFLSPEAVAELNRLIRLLKNNPSVKLEIQGHSDNLEELQKPGIALERANAVGSYLIENGYSNFEVKSYNNTVPIESNDTEEGRARNRRIEVSVLSR